MSSNDLSPQTDNAAVRERILDEIKAEGAITFRRFMEIALYLPFDGYYATARERIGGGGDYLTSPEISPLFGYAVAQQISEFWHCLGGPNPFNVLEAGAGFGTLAAELLRWLAARDEACYNAIRYYMFESSEATMSLLRVRLGRWFNEGKALGVGRLEDLAEPPRVDCVLANELLDSFPVHRVAVEHGHLREVYVTVRDSRLVEVTGEPSTPEIEHYFARLGLSPREGCRAEVNLAAIDWLRNAGATMRRGFLLLFDYGYPAKRLYAPWRRDGTLLCFYRHSAGDDPFVRLGRQDITSHVDFSTLVRTARDLGMTPLALVNQSEFLLNHGISSVGKPDPSQNLAAEEFYARRRAVSELVDPAGLGRLKVLLLSNGAPGCAFTGFRNAPSINDVLELGP